MVALNPQEITLLNAFVVPGDSVLWSTNKAVQERVNV